MDHFTDRAGRAMVMAQEEATRLNHDRVGTEHLLLGLVFDGSDGVACQALESLGISLPVVRHQVEQITGRADQPPPVPPVCRTRQADKALELARRESAELGHHYIGTEHILLGLITEADGVAARVLTGLGATPDTARAQVVAILDRYLNG